MLHRSNLLVNPTGNRVLRDEATQRTVMPLISSTSTPVRRRVAQGGQGLLARTDETTDRTTQFWLRAQAQAIIDSHSTKLANNASQVAGYV